MSCLLETHQLGKMDYKTAHELQRRYQQEVIAQRGIAGSFVSALLGARVRATSPHTAEGVCASPDAILDRD